MTKVQKAEIESARDKLRNLLPPGSTVHTILRSVSRTGMQRRISPVLVGKDGETYHPDYLFSLIYHGRDNGTGGGDGVKINGCGMDMGFELVYTISRYLYPEGYDCTGQGCPSNDHSNGDRDYTPHNHRDGGYALRQRWL